MTIIYKCDFCKREFTNEYLCKKHELYHKKKLEKNQKKTSVVTLLNKCKNKGV